MYYLLSDAGSQAGLPADLSSHRGRPATSKRQVFYKRSFFLSRNSSLSISPRA